MRCFGKNNKGSFLLVLLILIQLFGCNSSSDDNNISNESIPTYEISGSVYMDFPYLLVYVTPQDMLVYEGSFATIQLQQGDNTIAATTVDENARYVFSDVPNGTYNIIFDGLFMGPGMLDISVHNEFAGVEVNNENVIKDLSLIIG